MVGSTGLVCAGNDMDLCLFVFSHFTPPEFAAGRIFTREKICHLACIGRREVTRNQPDKWAEPVLAKSFSSRDAREAMWMLVPPTPYNSIDLFPVLVLRSSQH